MGVDGRAYLGAKGLANHVVVLEASETVVDAAVPLHPDYGQVLGGNIEHDVVPVSDALRLEREYSGHL